MSGRPARPARDFNPQPPRREPNPAHEPPPPEIPEPPPVLATEPPPASARRPPEEIGGETGKPAPQSAEPLEPRRAPVPDRRPEDRRVGQPGAKYAELDGWAAVRLTIVLVLIAAAIAAFGVLRVSLESGSRPASRSKAEEVLQRSIAYVHANDRQALCALERAQGPCIFEARTLDQVQVTDPVVVGYRQEKFFSSPIAVLELCMRVNGQPLYNDYVVIRTNDGIEPFYAAYWIQRLAENGNISTPAHRSAVRFDDRCGPIITAE